MPKGGKKGKGVEEGGGGKEGGRIGGWEGGKEVGREKGGRRRRKERREEEGRRGSFAESSYCPQLVMVTTVYVTTHIGILPD